MCLHINDNRTKYTSQMAKTWMRLKMFQLTHINDFLLISFYNWSYAESLGLNACKRVALITGMHLYIWCGFVLFRLDETTNKNIYRLLRSRNDDKSKNTGHDEVISFDLLWNEKLAHIDNICRCVFVTKLSDWSCRWLSFVLKIKPCMSKYELV